jgi:hypothetical protein
MKTVKKIILISISLFFIITLISCHSKIESLAESEKAIAYERAETYLSEGYTSAAAFYYAVAGDYNDAKEQYTAIYGQLNSLFSLDRHILCVQPDGSAIYCIDDMIYRKDFIDLTAVSSGSGDALGITRSGEVVSFTGSFSEQSMSYYPWEHHIIAVSEHPIYSHILGVTSDHTVVSFRGNDKATSKKINKDVAKWRDIVSVDMGLDHAIGLRRNGTVVAAGENHFEQCDVEDWTDIVAVAAGKYHTVGLRENGTVVATGDNDYKQCEVSDWEDIAFICADSYYTIGLKKDGSVLVAGDNDMSDEISSWKDVIAISSTGLGLRSDGMILTTGSNPNMQIDLSSWKLPVWAHETYLNNKVESIAFSEDTFYVEIGETKELQLNITSANTTYEDIEWSVDNSEFVELESGHITGLAIGQAVITATIDNKKSASCTVITTLPKYSYSEIKDSYGIYIKRGDDYYHLFDERKYGIAYAIKGACFTNPIEEEIPILLPGDEMVMFGYTHSKLNFFQVDSTHYIIPAIYQLDPFRFSYTENMVGDNIPESSPSQIDEINGVPSQDYLINGLGLESANFIKGTQNEEFTFGYYKRTAFTEFTTIAYAKCYTYNAEAPLVTQVEPTKDGYFKILYEDLNKGTYVVKAGDNKISNFEYMFIVE